MIRIGPKMYNLKQEIQLKPNLSRLFLDDFLIDTIYGISHTFHSAERTKRGNRDGKDEDTDIQYCYPIPEQEELNVNIQNDGGTAIVSSHVGMYSGVYLAVLKSYNFDRNRMEVYWVSSRDGIRWYCFSAEPLFAFDIDPVKDTIMELEGYELFYPEVSGENIFISCRFRQNSKTKTFSYRLRRDGWISLNAGDHRGTMVTSIFRCPGKDNKRLLLCINAGVKTPGYIKVSILDEHGRFWPDPDSSWEYGHPIVKDSCFSVIKRGGERDCRKWGITGKKIRLRFDMMNASLFSFGFFHEKP